MLLLVGWTLYCYLLKNCTSIEVLHHNILSCAISEVLYYYDCTIEVFCYCSFVSLLEDVPLLFVLQPCVVHTLDATAPPVRPCYLPALPHCSPQFFFAPLPPFAALCKLTVLFVETVSAMCLHTSVTVQASCPASAVCL